ncbi:LOW QUALITY PROTEIN: glutamyl-tRNA reductase, partial [Micromonospora sp. ATCC 39149]
MKLLVVGASYRTAPVATLEQLAVGPADLTRTLDHLLAQPYVSEAVLVSTCNRVEVYAVVSGFHGGLGDICAVLAERAGAPPASLANHLYVHYDAAAVDHVFRVAAGLDSMVVGEAQILGQLRDAYHWASGADSAGRLLHELMQQALRVGKRAHAETGIDRAGQSVVSAALDLAAGYLDGALAGRPALVVGAGAMGALGVATLSRLGAGPLTVTNRGADRAVRLAESYGASAAPMAGLTDVLSTVDIVVAATAATEPVLTREVVTRALAGRNPDRGPLVLLDLAVPRDVEAGVAGLPGVEVIVFSGWRRPWPAAPPPPNPPPSNGSSPPRSSPSSPGCAAPTWPRPWPPCAAGPRTWSPPSCAGWASAAPTSATTSAPRWPGRCTGWCSGCCTSPPCGSANSRPSPAATSTPRCCASCSTSRSRRPRPSTPFPTWSKPTPPRTPEARD